MKPRTIIIALACLACALPVPATDLYVSNDGSDAAVGTKRRPLETLEMAIEKARGEEGGATIWLRGGRYHPAGTIQLTEENSGTEAAPLVVRAVEGEDVTLSRGAEIPAALFRKVTDPALLVRLPEAARGEAMVADLAGTGLEARFPYRPDALKREAYTLVAWSGHTLQQATWPNRGYDYFEKTLEKGPTTRWLEVGEAPAAYSWEEPSGGRFTVRGELDLAALKRELERTGDVAVHGYLNNDWFFEEHSLGAVNLEETSLQLLRFSRYGIGNEKLPLPRRFRLVNVLCRLDEPGEWYYDHHDKLFYLWPVEAPTDEKPVTIAGGPPFIEARGVDHVVLRDLVFEGFGDRGVFFEDCNHILVGGCTFRSGIDLGLTLVDGMHNTIVGCDFHDLNRAFLLLGRYPREREYTSPYKNDPNYEYGRVGFSENRRDLVPEHNVARNNHIHHCRLRGYGLMAVGGVGAQFTHNLVHHLNGGLMFGHNDFLGEFNEFYEVGYEMGDWNAAYCGADLSLYNNLWRYNFAHHILETPRGHPMSAWRADDNASGLLTFGNIYYKCGRSAVQGSGPYNSIENSVAMHTPKLWWTVQKPYLDIPHQQFLEEKRAERIKTNEEIAAGIRSIYDKQNIIGKAEMVFGREGWASNSVWVARYPKLPEIFRDGFMDRESNPWSQSFTVVQRNYSDHPTYQTFHVHGRTKLESFEEQKAYLPGSMTFELPAELKPDAMFVDHEDLDFRMRDDFVPVDGFVEIPFEKIGLVKDEYRRDVPNKMVYRKAVSRKYRNVKSSGGAFDYDKLNERYPTPGYLE